MPCACNEHVVELRSGMRSAGSEGRSLAIEKYHLTDFVVCKGLKIEKGESEDMCCNRESLLELPGTQPQHWLCQALVDAIQIERRVVYWVPVQRCLRRHSKCSSRSDLGRRRMAAVTLPSKTPSDYAHLTLLICATTPSHVVGRVTALKKTEAIVRNDSVLTQYYPGRISVAKYRILLY